MLPQQPLLERTAAGHVGSINRFDHQALIRVIQRVDVAWPLLVAIDRPGVILERGVNLFDTMQVISQTFCRESGADWLPWSTPDGPASGPA